MAAAGGGGAGAARSGGGARIGLGGRGNHGKLQAGTITPAGGAANGFAFAQDKLLESLPAFFADVFKDRHDRHPESLTERFSKGDHPMAVFKQKSPWVFQEKNGKTEQYGSGEPNNTRRQTAGPDAPVQNERNCSEAHR
jgi:hypothetical protein